MASFNAVVGVPLEDRPAVGHLAWKSSSIDGYNSPWDQKPVTSAILILLAEDEPLLQIPAEDALRGGGFAVLLADSGDEAIRFLDGSIDEIAGLITDVRMGDGPTGWDVARHARSLKPQIPVVYATAESADTWAAEGVPRSIFVQKPCANAQLLTAISELLNSRD